MSNPRGAETQKRLRAKRSLFVPCQDLYAWYLYAQRPKNSHNRMITGIGTPSNQSRIPRPILSLLYSLVRGDNAGGKGWFLDGRRYYYQWPVFGIELHGSAGG
jgi:hypothetical protein